MPTSRKGGPESSKLADRRVVGSNDNVCLYLHPGTNESFGLVSGQPLLEALLDVSFTGVTGDVAFEESTGDRCVRSMCGWNGCTTPLVV